MRTYTCAFGYKLASLLPRFHEGVQPLRVQQQELFEMLPKESSDQEANSRRVLRRCCFQVKTPSQDTSESGIHLNPTILRTHTEIDPCLPACLMLKHGYVDGEVTQSMLCPDRTGAVRWKACCLSCRVTQIYGLTLTCQVLFNT